MAEPAFRTEPRDVDAPRLLLFAGSFVAFLATAFLVLHLLFGQAPSPLPFGAKTGLPGSGHVVLETDPVATRRAYETEEARLLSTYGWVDRPGGIARIPIEAAMELIAARGIPGWGTATASAGGDCAALAKVPRAPQAAACRNAGAPSP